MDAVTSTLDVIPLRGDLQTRLSVYFGLPQIPQYVSKKIRNASDGYAASGLLPAVFKAVASVRYTIVFSVRLRLLAREILQRPYSGGGLGRYSISHSQKEPHDLNI